MKSVRIARQKFARIAEQGDHKGRPYPTTMELVT
jgi:hypothetical protein